MPDREADVCLIVEGCYPFVRGGVSSWLDWLIRSQPDLTFHIISIWPRPTGQTPLYDLPDNALPIDYLYLHPETAWAPRVRHGGDVAADIGACLSACVTDCDLDDLRALNAAIEGLTLPQLLYSRLTWTLVERTYRDLMPSAAFLDYFWAWRSLFGGLFAVLKHPLPNARTYHAISTGYAGLLAANACQRTGAPAIVTEHGIYTNERRIEILLGDWITDSIDRGFDVNDSRLDLRDLWIRAFENYASLCYESCSRIVSLYCDNQRIQQEAGAPRDKLQVIPNGIDLATYAGISAPPEDGPPTIALIGRVTPIKDVLSFIRAAEMIRRDVPDLRAFVMGPTDEDPGYYEECLAAARALPGEPFLVFTGNVNVAARLPDIHVVVLTSLSEAQPLVLLEACAAGIACVTTDVGACREILEGPLDGAPNVGPAGIVTPVVSPERIAGAVVRILRDRNLRAGMAASARARAGAYGIEVPTKAYRDLYASLMKPRTNARGRV